MAIVVNSDASAFKRTANLPSATAYSMWGWFMLTTDRNTFSALLGITNGTNYHQLVTNADGTTLGLYRGNPGANDDLLALSLNTWYFAALTCSGTAAGTLIGYVRPITSNTFTSVSAAGISFTPTSMEWGRDGFTGEYISGRIHAVGAANAALSADELLELSYYHEPQLDGIRSLNVFYPTIESANTTATTDRSGNGRNATATVGALADSPPLLWRAPSPQIVLPAATASGAITGAVSFALAPAGAMTGTGALTSTTSFAFTPTGALTGTGALAGAVSAAFTPAGALAGIGALSSTVALSFAPTGAMTGSGALVGSVPMTFTPVGALTGNGALSGSVTVSFDIASTLNGVGGDQMAGAAGLQFSVVGALTGTGSLAGDIRATFGLSGTFDSVEQPASTDQPSGGFYWAALYERRLAERRKRRREREKALEELDDNVTREIAQILHKQERIDEDREHLQRLKALAEEHRDVDLPPRVQQAMEQAAIKGTQSALRALDRELKRMLEDEEIAVLMLLLND